MTRTDTLEVADAGQFSQRMGALRDDELDQVSGGDVYMHNPKGSNNRYSDPVRR
jgi:hypothetical protein